MKVQAVNLEWFRGAGGGLCLNTDSKNVIVYGSNGAGKSSFADALEYILGKGKVDHLTHKDIGSKQEKGIVNTQKPIGAKCTASITFDTAATFSACIDGAGQLGFDSTPKGFVEFAQQTWHLEQLLLRQDEVARFIIKTPRDKFSVLLPLLGLESLEYRAENLSNLSKSVDEASQLTIQKITLRQLMPTVTKLLDDTSDKALYVSLANIAQEYQIHINTAHTLFEEANDVHDAVQNMFQTAGAELEKHSAIQQIAEEELSAKVKEAFEKDDQIKGKVDQLLDTRIQILQQSEVYVTRDHATEFNCPACGRNVARSEFENHVKTELDSLQQLVLAREDAITARDVLRDSVARVIRQLNNKSFSAWMSEEPRLALKTAFGTLTKLDQAKWWLNFSSAVRLSLSASIATIDQLIKAQVTQIPPANTKLLHDLQVLEAVLQVQNIRKVEQRVAIASNLIASLDAAAQSVRDDIKSKTMSIIADISKDVQYLWSKLHPNEPIEAVTLYMPPESDRAIDVSLNFYGTDQPSPRFTLSEGHRNSLGLCIFFALARQEKNKGFPIFLDDIVSSLDREHRGNVTELLRSEFGGRQVLIFTHDREWFTELRLLLPQAEWKSLTLKPWQDPSTGIQWSTSEFTFDDARQYEQTNCELAGNCIRQIMDAQTAIAAEKLRVRMIYQRGDKNDRRTCVEFLEYIISEANKSLSIKDPNDKYVPNSLAISKLEEAKTKLIVRGNRGSHTGTLTKDEVEDLIAVCERAIAALKCAKCGDFVWVANQAAKNLLQCSCGDIHWKYS